MHHQDYKNRDRTKLRLKNKKSKTDDGVLERLELNDPITDYCNGLSFFFIINFQNQKVKDQLKSGDPTYSSMFETFLK